MLYVMLSPLPTLDCWFTPISAPTICIPEPYRHFTPVALDERNAHWSALTWRVPHVTLKG